MKRRINLIPASERMRTTTDLGLLLMLVSVIVVIFGLGFGYFLLDNHLGGKERELADVQEQLNQVETQIAALRQYEAIKVQKDRVEAVVEGIYAGRTPISEVLTDISLVVPETIWFQSLTLEAADPTTDATSRAQAPKGGDISIAATTYTFEDVAQLLTRVKLVPSLKEVELVSAAGTEGGAGTQQDIKTFTMKGTVVDTSVEDELPLSEIQVEMP
jgi:Tfp pilus assembly protein PilN